MSRSDDMIETARDMARHYDKHGGKPGTAHLLSTLIEIIERQHYALGTAQQYLLLAVIDGKDNKLAPEKKANDALLATAQEDFKRVTEVWGELAETFSVLEPPATSQQESE